MQVKNIELPVNDLFLSIKRTLNRLLNTLLCLLDFVLAESEQRHLLVDFLDTDALPERFTLEVLNDRFSLAFLIFHELIDVSNADSTNLLLGSLDLFALCVDNMLPCILANDQRGVQSAPVDLGSLLLSGFDVSAPT